ncbi:preprotein translocase subunit SecE [Atopomonas sediminilitoris]|uniref:preprotein translocase subunit SecE n=1 Tax=Atopomonas sediminilitoris TaxID=2919919 RepID=UPI001F4E7F4A|nr:preprotein translocase subunit SecE [Atopomonas sediminilitoris]MCJ8170899.1 preprotein translocase subunit SecE [Atopomonas sediminilitoris]
MTANTENGNAAFDMAKWVVVALLVASAVVGNHYFAQEPILYRVLGVLALAIVALLVVLQTVKGAAFAQMVKDARVEMRKVVWPNRQETQQTTLVVLGVVVVMALILWGMDSLLGWFVSLIIS